MTGTQHQRESPTPISGLYRGTVRHRRLRPRVHAFRLRTYHVLLDVAELAELDRTIFGFGYNRRAVTTFHDRDHFGPADEPIRAKITAWLNDHGLALPAGDLRVLTNLRVAGHVFNPVSWWFAYDTDDHLAMVLAEVSNTFGDHHVYVLDDLNSAEPADTGNTGIVRAEASKVLHVSPFLPIDGLSYRFTIRPPGERVLVHMDVDDATGKIFDATQAGVFSALSASTLWRAMLRHPVAPLVTIMAIHWHAVRLALKRTPFHRRPTPPDDGFALAAHRTGRTSEQEGQRRPAA